MATGTLDLKEVFTLLESQETDSIKSLIKENLSSTKESWLVHSLVDYYYVTRSTSIVGILCSVQEPHEKFLLEKLQDGVKSQEHQLHALQLLLLIVCKKPVWINKVVTMPVLKVVIKCLKVETNIPVLMTGVTIVTILLPSIPTMIGPYLPDLFEIFNRLASFSIKKPLGNTPDIFLLHLQISVYALFHRLYGMFPYNFLTYLRHYYTKKENISVFEETIKVMLERVRLHPLLITGNKEQETSTQRWRHMETHDVIVECAKMSLDPIEGTWEELHCPVAASRYMIDRSAANQDKLRMNRIPPISVPSVHPTHSIHDQSPGLQSQDVFWSPSEVVGLSTPPPSQRATPATNILELSTSSTGQPVSGGPPLVVHSGITPMNTPRETPPISEEHDRTMSRNSSRGALPKLLDPKRLSAEFTTVQTVPQLTPSSYIPSIPPSPLKAEFTSSPPLGLQTLPVLHAARELQFDHDQSADKPFKHMTRFSQSQFVSSTPMMKPSQSENKSGERSDLNLTKDNIQSDNHVKLESGQSTLAGCGSAFNAEDSFKLSSKDHSRTLSRSGSAQNIERSVSKTEEFISTKLDNRGTPQLDESTTENKSNHPVATETSESENVDTVSIENLSQVVEGLDDHDAEDNDDEVSELTSSSRSHVHMATITAESVAKFMKSVNRIRFNSLTATNSIEQAQSKFGSKHRSRSCPQLPKIETMSEEEEVVSRSASTTCQDLQQTETSSEDSEVKIDSNVDNIDNDPSDNVCDTSIQTNAINSSKCPVLAEKSKAAETSGEDEFMLILKELLNPPPPVAVCNKCQGHVEDTGSGFHKPFFSEFSPPELLDKHIRTGGDIHAKELSKLPIPSTQNVNWTHFGGVPPADEISILRGQLLLLHNQLMYERHKREQHAKRNRRLLRKIANTKMLEEQNNAKSDQLRQHDLEIRDLHVSLKLLQEENRKLKSAIESEEYEKLVHLRSCLQENEDLKNVKKEFNMLLVRQREEQDSLQQKLNASAAKLFNTEKELDAMKEQALLNIKLKEQVIQLQKELLLMGELQQKSQEKILSTKTSKAARIEQEHVHATYKTQIKDLKMQLASKTVQLDSVQRQLHEQKEFQKKRDAALSELKLELEKIKMSHNGELQSVEDKHHGVQQINQSLEAHLLQLYTELDEAKFKLNQVASNRIPVLEMHKDVMDSSHQETEETSAKTEFRERTNSDPEINQKHPHKLALTRMVSAPALPPESLGQCGTSSGNHEGHRSASADTEYLLPRLALPLEERNEILESSEINDRRLLEGGANIDRSETESMLSGDSSLFPGRQQMLYTDSEDNRSVSNRSHLGDSGFC